MKTNLFKVLNLTAIIFFISVSFANAQLVPNSNAGKTPEVASAEEKVNKITEDAGRYFKQGLLGLQDNRRPQARVDFDKSVETFLMSGVNVRSNQKLQNCYSQLIETVYRIEFPSSQQPQIKGLAATCNWNIDGQLVDSVVAKLSQPAPKPAAIDNAVDNKEAVAAVVPQDGFGKQEWIVQRDDNGSPLDELAKLELTQQEQDVYTPEAQAQFEYARVAVSNGSLGFRFQVHPMIQQFINFYQGRGRGTMVTGLTRSGMFVRMARRIFREQGVPENIIWLAQVESTWKPSALSWASASGIWQFIPGTGARYGLRRTAHVDERNSFEKATTASAQYLKFLADRYNGNWELALAAYNSGEGNVDRAIRRAGVANFWVAYPYLPKETRNYVPNILATILIANNPQSYGFGQVRPAAPLLYDQIRVPSSTGLGLIAQSSDTSVEYLRYLNPELRTNMTPPEPYVIRVPPGRANNVVAVLKRLPGANRNTASVTTAVAGENWQTISNRTGVSVEELRAANAGVAVPQRQVVVPNSRNVRKTNYSAPVNSAPVPTTGGIRVVRAQSGDTVAKIAARVGVSAAEVAKFNGLFPDSVLSAGREIKIPGR